MTDPSTTGRPSDLPALVAHLPPAPDPDALLDGFVDYTTDLGLELYPAQEEAILELLAGNNVILATPTGSGKSMVATAAHYAALAADRRSFYTAPIKALVSEKFFALRQEFGPERVGMITGDVSANPDAPIICCTAEILANQALRDGRETDVDVVIADEFHYYADPQRGWAWQVPLLELPDAQFLLISATLGPTDFFERELTKHTGRETVTVSSDQRPVPLDFEYRRTTLHQSISDLLETDRAPIYLVHFSQREATEAAQGYLSLDPLSKTEKGQVKEVIDSFRFDTPVGKELKRYLSGGVGVHHAGLLPKYRLLVERLAQGGLLKIICGTDTLGVGVNVPIRSVLFTQLCKYDGNTTRVLSNREFKQIAGRAGRKGFDDVGYVWAQAPAHVVENLRAEEKAAEGGKKRKAVKKKPPERGYAHWNDETFTKMINGDPEPLVSSFQVSHQMLLTLLDRPGDGCGATRTLLTTNHETRARKRRHIRRAISIYRSLDEAELLEHLDEPDDLGRTVRVNFDLQDDFALHQPLSLWALHAIEDLDPEDPGYAFSVLSTVEAVLESPGVIMSAQIRQAKDELMAAMKAEGVEYDERMERLSEVEAPKPEKERLYDSFDRFRVTHPWVAGDNVKLKSIVRDMAERAMTFREYVNHYGLKRSEGVVLRYLSDVYKGLVQNVPESSKTEEVLDITEWLEAVVRQVDSSLIDEWESLMASSPDDEGSGEVAGFGVDPDNLDITQNTRAFTVMVRNEMFRWVEALAHRRHGELPDGDHVDEMAEYWDEFDAIETDADARSSAYFSYDHATGRAVQILHDPDDVNSWRVEGQVDMAESAEHGSARLDWVRAYSL